MPEIYRVTVQRGGNLTIDVIGGQGPSCSVLPEALAAALGSVTQTEHKPEFYDHEQSHTHTTQY